MDGLVVFGLQKGEAEMADQESGSRCHIGHGQVEVIQLHVDSMVGGPNGSA